MAAPQHPRASFVAPRVLLWAWRGAWKRESPSEEAVLASCAAAKTAIFNKLACLSTTHRKSIAVRTKLHVTAKKSSEACLYGRMTLMNSRKMMQKPKPKKSCCVEPGVSTTSVAKPTYVENKRALA